MNLPQSHNEDSGILCMGIIGALLPLTLSPDESETSEFGDERIHLFRSVQ